MRSLDWQRIQASLALQGGLTLRKGGWLGLSLRGDSYTPLSHSLSGLTTGEGDLRPVVEDILRIYRLRTSTRFGGDIRAEALFPIMKKFMVGGSANYSRTPEGFDQGEIAIEFIF